jgi:hypothetical protein
MSINIFFSKHAYGGIKVMRVLGTYNNKENFGDLQDATIAFEFWHPLHAYGKPLHPIFSLWP